MVKMFQHMSTTLKWRTKWPLRRQCIEDQKNLGEEDSTWQPHSSWLKPLKDQSFTSQDAVWTHSMKPFKNCWMLQFEGSPWRCSRRGAKWWRPPTSAMAGPNARKLTSIVAAYGAWYRMMLLWFHINPLALGLLLWFFIQLFASRNETLSSTVLSRTFRRGRPLLCAGRASLENKVLHINDCCSTASVYESKLFCSCMTACIIFHHSCRLEVFLAQAS